MAKVNRTVLHDTVPTMQSFLIGGYVRTGNDFFVDSSNLIYKYVGTLPYPVLVSPNTVLDVSDIQTSSNPNGSWLLMNGSSTGSNVKKYGYEDATVLINKPNEIVLHNGMYYKTLSSTFPVTDLSDFENTSKWVNLGYLEGSNITDTSNFSSDKQKLTDAEFRLLVRAANHLDLDISNIGKLPVTLTGASSVNVHTGFVFNGATIDASAFKGTLNFVRRDTDIIVHDASSPVISAINSGTFIADQVTGLRGNSVLNDSFLIFETNQPYYKYRNEVANRREFNYLIRNGFLESATKYPIPKNTITSIVQHKASPRVIPVGGFNYYLGSNENNGAVQISNSKVLCTNVLFSMDDYTYLTSNPTLLKINRCDHFVGDNVTFQHAIRSTNSSGFTYNMSLSESFDVQLSNFKGVGDGWGSTGSNHCNRVTFSKCKLSRIDFHNPVYDYLKVLDCDLGNWGILATTVGDLIVERTSFMYEAYQYSNNLGIIRSRDDMGGWCDGNLIIRDIKINIPVSASCNLLRGYKSTTGGVVDGSPLKYTFFNDISIKGVQVDGVGTLQTGVVIPSTVSALSFPSKISIEGLTSRGVRTVFQLQLDSATPNRALEPHKPNLVVNLEKSQFSAVEIVNTTSNLFRTKLTAIGTCTNEYGEAYATKYEIPFNGTADLIGCDFGNLDFYYGTAPTKQITVNVHGGRVLHEARSENPTSVVTGVVQGLTRVNFFGTTIASHSLDAMYSLLACCMSGCVYSTFNSSGVHSTLRLPVVGSFSGGKATLLSNRLTRDTQYMLHMGFEGDGTFQPIPVYVPKNGGSYTYFYRGGTVTVSGEANDVISVTGGTPRGIFVDGGNLP